MNTGGIDRRQATRIQVSEGHLAVMEVGVPYGVRLLDVSTGGFLVSGPLPYPLDAERTFRFVGRDAGWRVELRARAVYSHFQMTDNRRRVEYLTGFSFSDAESRMIADRINDVMAYATSARTSSQG